MASLSNINGIFDVHSTGAILFSTSHGTSGQILRSNGNAAPTWVAASTVIGGPYLPLTGGTLTGPLSGTSATFSGVVNTTSGYEKNGYNVIGQNGTTLRINNAAYWQQLELFTNGTPRLTIQANGNTGIGTSTPTNGKLVIASTQNNSNDYTWLLFDNKASGYGDWSVYKSGNNNLSFGYGTSNGASYTNALTLEYGGNVGIGTDSPERVLHLDASQGRAIIQLDKGGDKIISMGTGSSATNADDTILQMFNEGSELVRIFTEGDSWFNGGDVGIGTASPDTRLHVHNTTNSQLTIERTGTAPGKYGFYTNTGNLFINNVTGGASTIPMIILNNGNVGIGAGNPSSKLAIDGGFDYPTVRWFSSNNTSRYMQVGMITPTEHSIRAYGSSSELTFWTASSFSMVIDSVGNVGIGVTGPSEKLHVDGNIAINDRIIGNSKNYATSQGWLPGAAGTFSSQIGYYGGNFNNNGGSSEQSIIWGDSPFGNRALQWQTIGESLSNADGGWNKNIDNLPDGNTHAYMSYVYVKRTSSATTGTFYYGCNTVLRLNGTVNTNPYFIVAGIGSLPQDVWCVAIGVIQAYTDNNVFTPSIVGVYRVDNGQKLFSGTSYRSQSGVQTTQSHRAYHYYSTDPAATLAFANPGFYVIDGTEPKLNTLVS